MLAARIVTRRKAKPPGHMFGLMVDRMTTNLTAAEKMRDAKRRNKPATATAIANAESLALIEAIAAALPDAGPNATWGDHGSAEHVRDLLRQAAEHLGVPA